MPRTLRHTLVAVREMFVSAGPLVVLTLVLLWAAYAWLKPAPPKRVVLATGSEQGAYAEFGKRYAAELRRYGIEVELRNTAGAAENLRLIRDPDENVDLAFYQGGASDALYAVDEDRSGEELVSLGSLFHEPVWLFYREEVARKVADKDKAGSAARSSGVRRREPTLDRLSQLEGLRVNIGAPNSGAANLVLKMLHVNRIDPTRLQVSQLRPTPSVMALLEGELDAVFFVSAPESPLVRLLLMTPGIRLFDFSQAEAYSRQLAFLSPLKLPRGVVDLANDVPPRDVSLVAPTAELIARADTHPAIIQLFAHAAQRIHGEAGWFARADQFPTTPHSDIPMSPEAERYYRNGPSLLHRYLPFWLANLVDRMWLVIVSLIAIVIPLSRIVPPLYEFRIRSRVFRWYARLREIEDHLGRGSKPPAELLRDLDELEARTERIAVPLSHTDELYALRQHIALVRDRLRQAGAG